MRPRTNCCLIVVAHWLLLKWKRASNFNWLENNNKGKTGITVETVLESESEATLAMNFKKKIKYLLLSVFQVKTIWRCRNKSFLLEFSHVRLTLAFHFHEREQFRQRSYECTCEFSSCPADRRSLLRHTNDVSAKSCLWPVLTISDRRRRVKRKKKKKKKRILHFRVCLCTSVPQKVRGTSSGSIQLPDLGWPVLPQSSGAAAE